MTREAEARYQLEERERLAREAREEQQERIQANFEVGKLEKLGKDCQRFWQSDLGRFILERATQDAQKAKDKLVAIRRVDFDRTELFEAAIIELQHEAHIPELVWTWLSEAIQNFYDALQLSAEKGTSNDY